MKLSNSDELVVERDKVADYLLNSSHRYGASKARFFATSGSAWRHGGMEAWRHGKFSLKPYGTTGARTKWRRFMKPGLDRATLWKGSCKRLMAVGHVCGQSGNSMRALLRRA